MLLGMFYLDVYRNVYSSPRNLEEVGSRSRISSCPEHVEKLTAY